jgi:hypothetical protein
LPGQEVHALAFLLGEHKGGLQSNFLGFGKPHSLSMGQVSTSEKRGEEGKERKVPLWRLDLPVA